MVATVGTAMIASSSAGTMVQPISRRVLPWTCLGFSFLPGRWRNLIANHDGRDDDRDADDDRDDQDRDEQVVDLLRLRALGLERVLPVVLDLGATGEDEHDGSGGGEDEPASPRAAWRHVPFRAVRLSTGAGGRSWPGSPARRHSTWANFRSSNFYAGLLAGTLAGRDGVHESGVVAHVVRRVFGGESGDGVVERGAGAQVAREGGGVPGPGVGPGQGPGAEGAVVRELAQIHPGEVALTLHVPELAHVVVVPRAVRWPTRGRCRWPPGSGAARPPPAVPRGRAATAPTYGASTDGCASFTWSTMRSPAASPVASNRQTQQRVPTLPTPTTRRATSTSRKRSIRKRRSSLSDDR